VFPQAASFTAKTLAEKAKDIPGIRNVFLQVFIDQFVHHPLMYFPVFYMIKDFVTSDKPDPVRAVKTYYGNMTEDLTALWKVWIPSTFLNFAFMPMWARIPWVASTSMIWTCILSAMRGGSEVPVEGVYGQVDGHTLELFSRAMPGPAPVLNPQLAHMLVTVHGADRPGIIRDVTNTLRSHEASVSHSKMMCLSEQFVIVMHVECKPAKASEVRVALVGVDSAANGLDVDVRTVMPNESTATPTFSGQVSLTGIDRPGLLYALSDVLSAQGLNIDHLQTEQHLMPAGDRGDMPPLFTTQCHVCGTTSPDLAALRKELKQLEADLGVRCSLKVLRDAGR